ncbi:aromatic ring-hydroxylating oxygenase subunit alpha [Thalassoroseus pseudoceratinae]|uniref:aromatic ring-hydroxylating oxygenase subunit alpha n=1 Tax=Thalassoroseus pseudoceratinae TaxID=2713176 RepID=UPI00141D91EC|nr:aromatic ring-hydroxylating dioxygenase subunit alpha [Thalassoroseus pseudoceratinae]
MFVHDSQLPQLLDASAYGGAEQHSRELASVFQPAWHAIATTDELADEGSFVTRSLLGKPLVLWRSEGELRAYLNVCPHRFNMLQAAESGCTQRLKCGYHGWEYGADGRTRRIPEAQGFRPIDTEKICLQSFPIETCGHVVFVSLSPNVIPLADWMADSKSDFESAFSSDRTCIAKIERDVPANWKIIVENALESYHLESVHTETFRRNPDPETCEHTLGEGWSRFETCSPPVGRLQRLADRVVYGVMGLQRDDRYRHTMACPHLMAGRAGMFTWCHTIEPLSAQSTRVRLWMFLEPHHRNIVSKLTAATMSWGAKRFTLKALMEDVAIATSVQQGAKTADIPFAGCLSPREERVWHFQQHLQSMLGGRGVETAAA